MEIYEFDGFRVDVPKRLLTQADGTQIPLTSKVFDTLIYLIHHRGKVIGKDELMAGIWSDSIVEENNLNQNISILRKVFGEKPGEQRFIVTVAGHGYRFIPEIRMVAGDLPAQIEGENSNSRSGSAQKRLIGLAVPAVLVVALTGFYFFSGIEFSSDAQIKTVAVLPFKPLVAGNHNESLELGMADALISQLSSVEEIIVRPLSSSRRYNGVEQDPLTAGRELGVDSILDGTIQNSGDRVRVSAKLIRTSDGKQLWAAQFDEKFTDILTVQDSISERVGAALKIRLAAKRKKHSTENIEAYQLYMKGRYNVDKLTPTNIRASIPYFQQAIEIDPQYALAYTGLSKAYGVLGISGAMPAAEAFPKAKAAEQRALEIDDTLGEAHNTRCMSSFWYDWEWQGAEKECRRAIEIDPNNADFHANFATLLSAIGRHDEALAEVGRSLELNPLDLATNSLKGQYLLHAGSVDNALAQLDKASELEPRFWMPHFIAASAYIEKGMFAEAITASDKERELTGGNVFPFGTYAVAKSGKRTEARAALQKLLGSSGTMYVPPYNVALIYDALDERGKALEWLEKGYEEHDPKMIYLKVEPKWKNLRNEPRFVDLMKRMNFQ